MNLEEKERIRQRVAPGRQLHRQRIRPYRKTMPRMPVSRRQRELRPHRSSL